MGVSSLIAKGAVSCLDAIPTFVDERTRRIATSILILTTVSPKNSIKALASSAIKEKAISVGLNESQASDIAGLVNEIAENPKDVSLIGKATASALNSISMGMLSTWEDTAFSISQIAMDEAGRIQGELADAQDTLVSQIQQNAQMSEELAEGQSFNVLRADLINVSANLEEAIRNLERRFKDNPPQTDAEFTLIEVELEGIRGLACGELNEDAQKYVSAFANYMNLLSVINQYMIVARDGSGAINRIRDNVCRILDLAETPSALERYTEISRSYIDVLLKELKSIDEELKEALDRQDPYALGRVIHVWCGKLSNLIALIDGMLRAPLVVNDPTKIAALQAICDGLDAFEPLSIERLELERGKVEQSFALIAIGKFSGDLYNSFVEEMQSFTSDSGAMTGAMNGNFGVNAFTSASLSFLKDSGLDIASSLFLSGDVQEFLSLDSNSASTVAKAISCLSDAQKQEDGSTQNEFIDDVTKNLVDIQVADAFASLSTDQLRQDGIAHLLKETSELAKIQSLIGL